MPTLTPSIAPTDGSPERASLADLRDRLTDLETRVRAAVELRRRGDPDPDDRFRGLYISDSQVDVLLSSAGDGAGEHADRAAAAAEVTGSAPRGLISPLQRADVEQSRLRRLAEAFRLDENGSRDPRDRARA